jgi:hypothetical protein
MLQINAGAADFLQTIYKGSYAARRPRPLTPSARDAAAPLRVNFVASTSSDERWRRMLAAQVNGGG